MDPSTAGGGQQQQRSQQPVYDIRQGGHYGRFNQSPPEIHFVFGQCAATMLSKEPIIGVPDLDACFDTLKPRCA